MPRFRIDAAPIPARRFRLPEGEHATVTALPELDKPFKLREWGPGVATETRKRPVAAQTPKRTAKQPVQAQMMGSGGYTVSAPVGARKGRRVLEFTAADETPMQAFMGTLALRIDAESVDLSRLENGVMALAIDHDVSQLMGRVTEGTIHSGRLDMKAEVGDTPTAVSAMSEIDDLMRAGFSPGFLILETEVIDPDHPDYDPDQYMQVICTRWQPYEISSTAIPRNPNARLKGIASMNGNVIAMDDVITGAPELVSTSDLIGLSLAAARQVLDSGQGSAAQRSRLQQFFKLFDVGLENGLSRDVAATAARAATGI